MTKKSESQFHIYVINVRNKIQKKRETDSSFSYYQPDCERSRSNSVTDTSSKESLKGSSRVCMANVLRHLVDCLRKMVEHFVCNEERVDRTS